jgi:hypothetical protein
MWFYAALACTVFLADAPTPAATDNADAYQIAAASAGRDADAHVRLALWCEAHGMPAERLRHLARAVLIDPKNTIARGLMGLVEDAGRWRKPEEVDTRSQADALAEYNTHRAGMKDTAQAHWNLGVWCAEHGLRPEATAHFTAVTRLDPTRESAWKRLGFVRHRGRWMTPEQIAAEAAERTAQQSADRHWLPRLEKWRTDSRKANKRAGIDSDFASVTEPRAVPAIWHVLTGGDEEDHVLAVRLFGQIRGEGASRALALLATFSPWSEVRRAAAETLTWRDDREFLNLLIGLLRDPIRFQFQQVNADGPGSPGMLVMETPAVTIFRVYRSTLEAFALPPPELLERAQRQRSLGSAVAAGLQRDVSQQQLLASDVSEAEANNASVGALNDAVWRALSMIRKPDLGPDPEAWRAWAADVQGYAYRKYNTRQRQVFFQNVNPPPAYDCFAAGTTVRTRSGTRPIEEIRVGDQVLMQDTRTGALGFQPVLAARHYDPAPTLRIRVGDESLVATGIHRFWKPGQGWTLARDLKPGDPVRVIGGTRRLDSVRPDQTRNVFNLEVAAGHTFFVGKTGILVHDDSLEGLAEKPFDGATGP